jgi:predicted GIY-YIG superfamily endonuclease
MDEFIIYTLLLTDDKYYIGKTKIDPEERFQQHLTDKSIAWTLKYKPLKIINTFKSNDSFAEDKCTKEMMMKYDIENVRGGSYCSIELPDWQVKALEHEFESINEQCYKCKKEGHFSKDCEKYHKKLEQDKYNEYLDSLNPITIILEPPSDSTEYKKGIDRIIYEIKQVDNYILKIEKLNNKIKQTNINTNLNPKYFEIVEDYRKRRIAMCDYQIQQLAPKFNSDIKLITKKQISEVIIWFNSYIEHKIPNKKLREIFNSNNIIIDFGNILNPHLHLHNLRATDISMDFWKNHKLNFIKKIDENIDLRLEIREILKESFFNNPIINKKYTNKDVNYDELLEKLFFIKELLLQKKVELFYSD